MPGLVGNSWSGRVGVLRGRAEQERKGAVMAVSGGEVVEQ